MPKTVAAAGLFMIEKVEQKPMKCTLTVLALALVAGCSSKTETGYEPRKLGDNLTVQRGYYASPYSPEAAAAQQERAVEIQHARPDFRN